MNWSFLVSQVDGADKGFFYQHVPGLVEPNLGPLRHPEKQKTTWKNHAPNRPNPPKLGNASSKVHRYFIRTGLFLGGRIFCLQPKRRTLKHSAFWTPRCVSGCPCVGKIIHVGFQNIGYLKDGILKPSKYDPKWRVGGVVPPILRYALFFSKRLVCRWLDATSSRSLPLSTPLQLRGTNERQSRWSLFEIRDILRRFRELCDFLG